MALKLVTPPASEPVALVDVKAHLNVVGTADDDLLSRMITGAIATLDGPFGDLGRCLIEQTWELTLDAFPKVIEIPLPPAISVDSIDYLDPDGASVAMSSDDYRVTGIATDGGAKIRHLAGWPSTYAYGEAVTVTFTAGYGDAEDVPSDLIDLIMMRVAAAYANRESVYLGANTPVSNPDADAIVNSYRTRAF